MYTNRKWIYTKSGELQCELNGMVLDVKDGNPNPEVLCVCVFVYMYHAYYV